MLSREAQLQCVAEAGRVPSPHNIQPARWRFSGDVIELWEEPTRWLTVGDPHGRDNLITLGMAWEGMRIALSQRGLTIINEQREVLVYPSPTTSLRRIAVGTLQTGVNADALAEWVNMRSCWRGRFMRASEEQTRQLRECLAQHAITCEVPLRARVLATTEYDAAAAAGLANPAFAQELYRWMRFARHDPDWSRDGLAADCMVLSGIEAWGASIALRPAVVRWLTKFGLTQQLVSERAKVESATALVAIHAPADASPFAVGAAWYRFWLSLTQTGFAGVPMSALVDDPVRCPRITASLSLPARHILYNLMRVGPAPADLPRSARLPTGELLL